MIRSTTRRFSLSLRAPVVPTLLAAAALLCGQASLRADTTESIWSGTTSSDWSIPSNWGAAGVPSATVSAEFNSAFTNQPNLSGSSTAQGIWVTGSTTTGVSGLTDIGSTTNQTLAITGTATLNGRLNTGILLDGSANNNLTLDSSITTTTISNTTSFLVDNTGTLTIAGALNLNGKTLTIAGVNPVGGPYAAGNVVISGNIGNSTGTGVLTMNGPETLRLSGNNTFNGGTNLNTGTLLINSSTALGTGAFTIGLAQATNGNTGLPVPIIDNTSSGAVSMTSPSSIIINNNFEFAGTKDLNFGVGITMNNDSAIYDPTSGSNLIFSGTETSSRNLWKAGRRQSGRQQREQRLHAQYRRVYRRQLRKPGRHVSSERRRHVHECEQLECLRQQHDHDRRHGHEPWQPNYLRPRSLAERIDNL